MSEREYAIPEQGHAVRRNARQRPTSRVRPRIAVELQVTGPLAYALQRAGVIWADEQASAGLWSGLAHIWAALALVWSIQIQRPHAVVVKDASHQHRRRQLLWPTCPMELCSSARADAPGLEAICDHGLSHRPSGRGFWPSGMTLHTQPPARTWAASSRALPSGCGGEFHHQSLGPSPMPRSIQT